jgi:carbon-monoxide dehydrogenase medium subunit
MIPAQFDYAAPSTLDEAVALLASHADDAKILAGGHSLLPAMKLRLAQPAVVIDIGRIKDLSYILEDSERILIGAMTTHYEIESSARLKEICPLLPECAASIGDAQVRNRGTIGGSLAHADPAGDFPPAVLALGAEIVAVSPRGERTIKIEEFFVDMLTTALTADEILREIRVPVPPARSGHAYEKVPQPASGFAVVGVAVQLTRGADGKCETAVVALTGVGAKAYRASGVEQALIGTNLDAQAISNASSHAADRIDANSDLYASADYRQHLARVHTRRAIERAASRVA